MCHPSITCPPPHNHHSPADGTPRQPHRGSQPLMPGVYTPPSARISFPCLTLEFHATSIHRSPLMWDFQFQPIEIAGGPAGYINSNFPVISASHNTDKSLLKRPENDNYQTSIPLEAKSFLNQAPSTNTSGNTTLYANNIKEGAVYLNMCPKPSPAPWLANCTLSPHFKETVK